MVVTLGDIWGSLNGLAEKVFRDFSCVKWYIHICTDVSLVNYTSIFRIKYHKREFLNYLTSYQSTRRSIPEGLKLITLNW